MKETLNTAFLHPWDRTDPKPDLNVEVAYHRTESRVGDGEIIVEGVRDGFQLEAFPVQSPGTYDLDGWRYGPTSVVAGGLIEY